MINAAEVNTTLGLLWPKFSHKISLVIYKYILFVWIFTVCFGEDIQKWIFSTILNSFKFDQSSKGLNVVSRVNNFSQII